jgi:prenyltransferase/squalene oxidase-like repeat protein
LPPAITTVRGRWRRPWRMSSPFVAAAAGEAFSAAGQAARADATVAYLRHTREADGSWSFEPHGRRWPPDADSTSCALAALAALEGASSEPILQRIIEQQPAEGGLLRPWLIWYPAAQERLDGNVADAIVTANVLLAAQRLGQDPGRLLATLEDHVRANGLERLATVYYDSLPVRAYYLARAVAGVSPDGPTARAVRALVSGPSVESANCVDAAAAIAAAALVGVDADARSLLALQQKDGSWPEASWFTDSASYSWRSRAFSTALAVEALSGTALRRRV